MAKIDPQIDTSNLQDFYQAVEEIVNRDDKEPIEVTKEQYAAYGAQWFRGCAVKSYG